MKAAIVRFARLLGLRPIQIIGIAALLLLLTQSIALVRLTGPLLILHIFDGVLEGGRIESLLVLLGLFIIAQVIGAVLHIRFLEVVRSVSVVLERRLLVTTIRVAMRAARTGRPELATTCLTSMSDLRNFLAGSALANLLALTMVPLPFVFLFAVHPALGWIGVAGAITVALLNWNSYRVNRNQVKLATAADARAKSGLARHLQRKDEVEGLGLLPGIVRHWLPQRQEALTLSLAADQRSGAMDTIADMAARIFSAAAAATASWLTIHDLAAPSIFAATFLIFALLLQPFVTLSSQWSRLSVAYLAVQRLRAAMAEEVVAQDVPAADPAGDPDLHVVGLRLEVPDSDKVLVDDLTLHMKPGSVMVITGRNAAGKSTLLRALVGLVTPAAGGVMFGGWLTHAADRAVLGPRIGFLGQRAQLMAGTVMDNICRFTGDTEGALLAARLSGAHEMIGRLPAGYSTRAEASAGLSGGQQRQVAIARAMYGNPDLLILDEPEVGLDEPAVAALVSAVARCRQRGAIVVLVTHDLGRWQKVADLELHLDRGGRWTTSEVQQQQLVPMGSQ